MTIGVFVYICFGVLFGVCVGFVAGCWYTERYQREEKHWGDLRESEGFPRQVGGETVQAWAKPDDGFGNMRWSGRGELVPALYDWASDDDATEGVAKVKDETVR